MEQWVQYVCGLGVMIWFLKELIKRTDKLERTIDKLGDKLEESIASVRQNFRSKDRCNELRKTGQCGTEDK